MYIDADLNRYMVGILSLTITDPDTDTRRPFKCTIRSQTAQHYIQIRICKHGALTLVTCKVFNIGEESVHTGGMDMLCLWVVLCYGLKEMCTQTLKLPWLFARYFWREGELWPLSTLWHFHVCLWYVYCLRSCVFSRLIPNYQYRIVYQMCLIAKGN